MTNKTKRRGSGGASKTKKSSKKVLSQAFKVMTFNVEVFLNLVKDGYPNNLAVTETDVQLASIFSKFLSSGSEDGVPEDKLMKWRAFKELFEGVDIACIQEDAIVNTDRNYLDMIGHLKMASYCKSHNFYWPVTRKLFGETGYLANSIYINPTTVLVNGNSSGARPSQLTNANGLTIKSKEKDKEFPRCWAFSKLNIGGNEITVASIHLSGGRDDDIQSLSGDNYLIKFKQILELINKESPMIICGDLNTKLPSQSPLNIAKDDAYFLGLPLTVKEFYENKDKKKKNASIKQIMSMISSKAGSDSLSLEDKWKIWLYGLHNLFLAKGYVAAYDATSVPITSVFGGTVDMVYFKKGSGLSITNVETKEAFMTAADGKKQKYLSDHLPVIVTFTKGKSKRLSATV
jgi:endonuclease/exonuclease/phosphatase family metal-dependent hydrolase